MNRRTMFRMLLAAPLAAAAVPMLLPRKPETVTVKLAVDDSQFRSALHAASQELNLISARYPDEVSRALYAEGERIMEESKQMRPLHLTPPYADGLVRRP